MDSRWKEPDWTKLIDALCRFDADALNRAAQGCQTHLAQLLRFIVVEDPASTSLLIDGVNRVLRVNPECYRAHDASAQAGGVSHKHRSTLEGMRTLTSTLGERVAALPQLPARVAELLRAQPREAELVRALVEEGRSGRDNAEPSWCVVGRLLQEERFVQVCRRLEFMARVWSVPVDEFLREARPLVAGHRWEAFVNTYTLDPARDRAAYRAALEGLLLADLELTARPVLVNWNLIDPVRAQRIGGLASLQTEDATYHDLALASRLMPVGSRANLARRQLTVSPHSPYGRALLIEDDWAYAEPRLATWRASHGRSPAMQAALGRRFRTLGRWEEAEACLKDYIQQAPDAWAYEALAQTRKDRGDLDGWRQTLEEYLKQDDPGLNHARVRVELARHFMARKEWAKAQPYAEAAAETWAEWAMRCAADCAEGAGDWKRAELWMRRTAERYSAARLDWYFWCHRTGQGDAAAALQLAQLHAEQLRDRASPDDLLRFAAIQLLRGPKRQALGAFQRNFAQNRTTLDGLFVVLLADELGMKELRDTTLEQLSRGAEPLHRLAALLSESLSRKQPLDGKVVDAALTALAGTGHADGCYVVGRFLELRGETKRGRTYLERCAASPEGYPMFRALAAQALRQGGWPG